MDEARFDCRDQPAAVELDEESVRERERIGQGCTVHPAEDIGSLPQGDERGKACKAEQGPA
jgi:hypothetical protein